MVRRGPKHTGRIHEIAVALDGHRDNALVAVGERRTDRGRSAVANARSAGTAKKVVILSRRP